MKFVLASLVSIFAFTAQAYAINLSCDNGQITITSRHGVNYLNGHAMKTRKGFALFGAPGKFMVLPGTTMGTTDLWIFETRNPDFVSRIVNCSEI